MPRGSAVKNLPAMQEPQDRQIQSLVWEDPLEEGMQTHSSIVTSRLDRLIWMLIPNGFLVSV